MINVQLLQVFNKNYNDYMLCVECCNSINSAYDFSNRCIKSLNTFLNNVFKSCPSNNQGYEFTGKTEDVRKKSVMSEKSIEQDKSNEQEVEVMVHSYITKNKLAHCVNNVKLEQFDEDYPSEQNFDSLKSDENISLKMELAQDFETTDMLLQDISENVQEDNEIKIEADEKAECLEYEFIACDGIANSCQVTKGEKSI